MENMVNSNFWYGRRVLITGHTGFKGGWLVMWLQLMGVEVYGYALNPVSEPNLFSVAGVGSVMRSSKIADIRDSDKLMHFMNLSNPEIVFHIAAQPLVRYSYTNPVETYKTNIMGTVHLLEAVRAASSVRAVVNITSDKCYENYEWIWGYRENEPMGGFDPYSSSKGCSELVSAAYRQSYFEKLGVALATARAGNVIGGGDWSEDRLIPDCIKAFSANRTVLLRYTNAIRPWQHVLEPLSGCIMLAERLCSHNLYAEAWNFGPDYKGEATVYDVASLLAEEW